jgi:HlyD family secretion protein
VQLHLKKKQLESQVTAVLGRRPDIALQLASLQEQLASQERERVRVTNLIKGDAATQKQLDDIESSIAVLRKQIGAQQSTLQLTSTGLANDAAPLRAQIEQLDDQLARCRLVNPVNGTVLEKYVEPFELAVQGKPLYKIADLSDLILRVYVSGDQLPLIRLNQKVKVFTDDGKGGYTEHAGTVSWINSKAEFTPKTIQTRDERANMVYAVKINVPNDGTCKIGMYGEIRLD